MAPTPHTPSPDLINATYIMLTWQTLCSTEEIMMLFQERSRKLPLKGCWGEHNHPKASNKIKPTFEESHNHKVDHMELLFYKHQSNISLYSSNPTISWRPKTNNSCQKAWRLSKQTLLVIILLIKTQFCTLSLTNPSRVLQSRCIEVQVLETSIWAFQRRYRTGEATW